MKNKLVFAAGMAVGYVLGSRAGRESYEQLKTKAQELWNDPKVQDTVSSTTEAIKDKAPEVQESLKGALNKDGSGSDTLTKVKDAASDAADKAKNAASEGADKAKGAASEGADKAKDAANKGADKAKDGAEKAKGAASEGADKAKDGADKAKNAANKSGNSVKDASPVVEASGNTGPSGGDPYEVEEAPFQEQDKSTRPDLGK